MTKKRKRNQKSYKAIMAEILKPKEEEKKDDTDNIKKNTGGGVCEKVSKI
jgi:hypothetical protein